jgi:hypothetical protein
MKLKWCFATRNIRGTIPGLRVAARVVNDFFRGDEEFLDQDSRFKIQDSRFKIQDSRFKRQDSRGKRQEGRASTSALDS